MYTTGDVEGAVKLFLGLLKGAPSVSPSLSLPGSITGPNGPVAAPPPQEAQANLDKIFLEDFRVAFTVSGSLVILKVTLSLSITLVALGGNCRGETGPCVSPPSCQVL